MRTILTREGCFGAVLAAVLCWAPPLAAVEVGDLYTAEVAWAPGESRERAYRAALREVLVKVTGDPAASRDQRAQSILESPSRLVLGYGESDAGSLFVSFDGRLLAAEIDAAGLPVWGADRPLTIVWLALDKGRGDRQILAASERSVDEVSARRADPADFLRERARAVASSRGLPLVFPLMDTVDQAAVSVADIQGGFVDRVLQASERYRATSILIGRANTRAADRIQWEWVFGTDRQQFNGSVESAGGRVADAMSGLFAISGAADIAEATLFVGGVSQVDDYGALSKRLRSMPQIRSCVLQAVRGDELEYRLELVGGVSQLRSALARDERLEVDEYGSQQPIESGINDLRERAVVRVQFR